MRLVTRQRESPFCCLKKCKRIMFTTLIGTGRRREPPSALLCPVRRRDSKTPECRGITCIDWTGSVTMLQLIIKPPVVAFFRAQYLSKQSSHSSILCVCAEVPGRSYPTNTNVDGLVTPRPSAILSETRVEKMLIIFAASFAVHRTEKAVSKQGVMNLETLEASKVMLPVQCFLFHQESRLSSKVLSD
jgi:hypothetical protein